MKSLIPHVCRGEGNNDGKNCHQRNSTSHELIVRDWAESPIGNGPGATRSTVATGVKMALSKFSASVSVAVAALTLISALSVAQDSHRKYSYALVTKDGNSIVQNWSLSTHGDMLNKRGPDRIYVKKDGKTFVITDAGTIAQMKKAVDPMIKIGNKQSAIGEQQSKIGEEQSRIGEKQGKLGEQMGMLGEQMGKLSEQAARQDSDDEIQAKLDEIQKKMDVLQKQMNELGRQMDKPSKRQNELGRKQEELGRQQEKASAEAEKKIVKIIDGAFAKGLAKEA